MTLPQVTRQFEYWRKHPPVHELVALQIGFKPALTSEEEIAQGAMGPEDFAAWVKATGGSQMGPV